jgi:hypothetical protein
MKRYIYFLFLLSIFYASYADIDDMETFRVNINNRTTLPLTVFDSATEITYAIAPGNFISIEPLDAPAPGRKLTIIGKQQYSEEQTQPLIIPAKGGDLNIKSDTVNGQTKLAVRKLIEQQ